MNLARKPAARAALAMAALIGLAGCAPLIVGGAMVGGALVATDRRTTGAQVEDQSIELKASRRIDQLATLGHVNVTSYNRKVLLTGEVPAERERERVEQAVRQIENVQAIVNELAVAGNSSLGARSNDAYLSTKVKASLVDAKDLQSNAIKVLTERGVVYLMGRVTEREATRASNLARTVPGVQKVVQVFEVLSEAELAELVPPKSSDKK
jgi:osmotically-inducible protein OsmY